MALTTTNSTEQVSRVLGSVVVGLTGEVCIAATGLTHSAAARVLGTPDRASTAALPLSEIESRLERAITLLQNKEYSTRAYAGDASQIASLHGEVIRGTEKVKLSVAAQLSGGAIQGVPPIRSLEENEKLLRKVLGALQGTCDQS